MQPRAAPSAPSQVGGRGHQSQVVGAPRARGVAPWGSSPPAHGYSGPCWTQGLLASRGAGRDRGEGRARRPDSPVRLARGPPPSWGPGRSSGVHSRGGPTPKSTKREKDLDTKPTANTPHGPGSFFEFRVNRRCLFRSSLIDQVLRKSRQLVLTDTQPGEGSGLGPSCSLFHSAAASTPVAVAAAVARALGLRPGGRAGGAAGGDRPRGCGSEDGAAARGVGVRGAAQVRSHGWGVATGRGGAWSAPGAAAPAASAPRAPAAPPSVWGRGLSMKSGSPFSLLIVFSLLQHYTGPSGSLSLQ